MTVLTEENGTCAAKATKRASSTCEGHFALLVQVEGASHRGALTPGATLHTTKTKKRKESTHCAGHIAAQHRLFSKKCTAQGFEPAVGVQVPSGAPGAQGAQVAGGVPAPRLGHQSW